MFSPLPLYEPLPVYTFLLTCPLTPIHLPSNVHQKVYKHDSPALQFLLIKKSFNKRIFNFFRSVVVLRYFSNMMTSCSSSVSVQKSSKTEASGRWVPKLQFSKVLAKLFWSNLYNQLMWPYMSLLTQIKTLERRISARRLLWSLKNLLIKTITFKL